MWMSGVPWLPAIEAYRKYLLAMLHWIRHQ
jgi:hypothetical protein